MLTVARPLLRRIAIRLQRRGLTHDLIAGMLLFLLLNALLTERWVSTRFSVPL